MNFIKKHKAISIVVIICIILLVLLFIAVYSIFNPTNKRSIYGSRLDGEVAIDEGIVDTIKNEISLSSIVTGVSYNKNVRTINFIIDVKDEAKEEEIQKLSESILKNFSKEVLGYYDTQIYIENISKTNFILGYKSKNSSEFTWSSHRGGSK